MRLANGLTGVGCSSESLKYLEPQSLHVTLREIGRGIWTLLVAFHHPDGAPINIGPIIPSYIKDIFKVWQRDLLLRGYLDWYDLHFLKLHAMKLVAQIVKNVIYA